MRIIECKSNESVLTLPTKEKIDRIVQANDPSPPFDFIQWGNEGQIKNSRKVEDARSYAINESSILR